MPSDKEFAALAQIVLKQRSQLEGAAKTIAALARVVISGVKRCSFKGCERIAVMRHDYTGITMCESCTARTIVKAKKDYLASDESDELNTVRGSLMNEAHWEPVPGHESISLVQDYIDCTAALDIADKPREVEGLN